MDAEWLTYREAAARLGSNIEAVRQRAIRSRWPRTLGNDKRARVQIPEGVTIPVREGNEGGIRRGNARKGNEGASDGPLINALEARIEDLKQQLGTTEARLAAADASLAAEQAKTEKAIAAFSALAERLDVLATERARPWWRRLAG